MKMAMPISGMTSTRFNSPSCSLTLSPAAMLQQRRQPAEPKASSQLGGLVDAM